MAVQTALAQIDAPEIQLMRDHPTGEFIRRYAAQVLGDAKQGQLWLDSEIRSLGFATPSSLLEVGDDASLRRVLKVKVQIDYGVVA